MGGREPEGEIGFHKKILIPYHFGKSWDILPNREPEEWEVLTSPVISERLLSCKSLVRSAWLNSQQPIVVSGDCMAALACQQPLQGLVWFDAHGDFHDWETTRTGSIGGMPLRMMVEDKPHPMRFLPRDKVQQCWHVGGSEFDPGEKETMEEFGVNVLGLEGFTAKNLPTCSIHLHIDTDVVRTEDLPHSIHPAPNGLPLEILLSQIRLLSPLVGVFSIKSPDPTNDLEGVGESVLNKILGVFLGHG